MTEQDVSDGGLEFDIGIDVGRLAGSSVSPWYSAVGEMVGWSWQAYAGGRFRSGMASNEVHARHRASRVLEIMLALVGPEK